MLHDLALIFHSSSTRNAIVLFNYSLLRGRSQISTFMKAYREYAF